jgi:ABC-type uncharacterized transport system permease subunit
MFIHYVYLKTCQKPISSYALFTILSFLFIVPGIFFFKPLFYIHTVMHVCICMCAHTEAVCFTTAFLVYEYNVDDYDRIIKTAATDYYFV